MTYHEQIAAYERSLIQAAVDQTESTYGAAKMLGLNRTTFIEICRRLGVQRKVGRNAYVPKHQSDGAFASPRISAQPKTKGRAA